MTNQEAKGQYTVKETGAVEYYDFTYSVFDSIEDAIENLGASACLKLVQRQTKVDANNISREKSKTANGHSTRVVMSEEEKAEKKAQRQQDKMLLEALKANPDLLAQVQG